jgi:hypothetical protein
MSLIGRFMESMIADGGYSSILAFFTQIGGAPSMAPAAPRRPIASRATTARAGSS